MLEASGAPCLLLKDRRRLSLRPAAVRSWEARA